MATRRFYLIDDHSGHAHEAIWDEFLLCEMPKLPTKPLCYNGPSTTCDLPEGDWSAQSCSFMDSSLDGAYRRAGFTKPSREQIPAIFCVTDAGVEQQFNVTAAQAADFVRARIS